IDVDDTFSLVVKPTTIRTVLSLAISRHFPVHQLDSRPDGRDTQTEGTSVERDVRMEGTPEWKHASMLGKEDEWQAGAVKINPTEICLNKLAPSVGPVIQSTKAKNDGSLFLFGIMPFGTVEGHVYDVRHASFGIVHGGPRVRQFKMVPSTSCPLDCIRENLFAMKIDQHHDNAESGLIESLLNHDSSIISSSSKIDSLLDEFAGELTLLKSIPSGIDETDYDPEEDIRLIERSLYDNSSPRPPEEFISENSNAEIESFSPSPILVEDSDSFMKEIVLSFTPDDPIPPGIEEDDYDSERDILILEELLDNYSLSLPENE
nr:ribonuclease H-like domain-containing protein [Tanacetum cinerariifolium]